MTKNTTPTETVDEDLRDIFFKAAGGISDMAKDEIAAAKAALRKALESAMEAVIGEDVDKDSPAFKQHDFGYMSANAINNAKKLQRQRAKEQIKLMFGE